MSVMQAMQVAPMRTHANTLLHSLAHEVAEELAARLWGGREEDVAIFLRGIVAQGRYARCWLDDTTAPGLFE